MRKIIFEQEEEMDLSTRAGVMKAMSRFRTSGPPEEVKNRANRIAGAAGAFKMALSGSLKAYLDRESKKN